PYIADFASLSLGLVIELDGGQHVDQVRQDEARTLFLRAKGFAVLRFWNDDVHLKTEIVLEEIWQQITALSPTLSRKRERESER
ncbi:MAG: DUF559 domain-containing protein, partial [Betaproteobacteria bacterium]|nr:DUF559 domain-containing protein [Betaproteobacteria bacterium]